MQRAFVAGIIIGIIAPVVGVFMVLRKLSLIGDSLAHTAFAGIAIGLFLNIVPFWSAIFFTILSALGIVKLRESSKISGDAALGVFFSTGLAVGIIVLSLTPNANVNISNILFGSILTITYQDLILTTFIGVIVLIITYFLYNSFLSITLDEELASTSGLPVSRLNSILLVLVSLVIVSSMRIIGILLVSSLIIIPAVISIQLSRSFKETIIVAMVIGVSSVLIGLSLSYYGNIPSGASITFVNILIFAFVIIFKKLFNY